MKSIFEQALDYVDYKEPVTEGTMADIRVIKKSTVKEYKASKQSAESALSRGDYDEAIRSLKMASNLLKKIDYDAGRVPEPEFIDYLKRVLLWSLVCPGVLGVGVGIYDVVEAKNRFNCWITKETRINSNTLNSAMEMKKFAQK